MIYLFSTQATHVQRRELVGGFGDGMDDGRGEGTNMFQVIIIVLRYNVQ